MPVKGKPNRVTKTCRPNQKTAILPGSAEEQAALFAEHANGTSRTRSHQSSQNSYINPSHSSSSSMEANLHFPSASILDGSQNGSDTKQMSFYSDVDAEGDEELVSVNPLTGLARTAEDVVFDVYGDIIKIDSALCKKLAREAAIRPPTQRRTEQKLNMERRSNVEALLAHITGEPSPQPCKNCHKGHGPWTECIIYDGQMCGSCTNCWFNASGSRCTYHAKSDNNHLQTPIDPPTPSPTGLPPPPSSLPYHNLPPAHNMPPVSILQSNGTNGWGLTAPTRLLVSQAMGNATSLSPRDRLLARIEAAAEELGIRIAEYNEYLHTPDGIAEQQRFEEEEEEEHRRRMQAHGRIHEPSIDSGSIDDGGM